MSDSHDPNQEWQLRVSASQVKSGWHCLLVRARSEEKVRDWLKTKMGDGLKDALIPSWYKDVARDSETIERVREHLWTVFAKFDKRELDLLLSSTDRRERGKVGIRQIWPVQDIQVYQMMESCSKAPEQYKVGDRVVRKDQNDHFVYQITDVEGSRVRMVAHIFGQPMRMWEEMRNIALSLDEKT